MISSRDRVPLFVYGTLKTNGENHFRLKDSELVGIRHTKPEYHLFFIMGDSPDIKRSETDHEMVEGELYLVPKDILHQIDEYEVPYVRRIIELEGNVKAYAYFD